MDIGIKLRALRRARELTQEELADFLGVSFQAVSKWERGEGYPDITLLPPIARYFDVSLDELLGADEERKRAETYRELLKKYPNDITLMLNLAANESRRRSTC
ncbi:MAG: helix-turn-helix domain-containing protein [Oscillospiraceae bacterium]|jgi:transcriptional regulator with XRE-family HTH domain|nr:helix-turn-helix domain-containing protein [Oscillospiraceae bacterium]